MTTYHRPGPLALVGGVALALGLAGIGAAWARPSSTGPQTIVIPIHYSHYLRPEVTVQVGVPVTIVLRNDDPIDHEWILGDDAVQAVHRVGTELLHPTRPTEVVIPALSSRTTTISFEHAGALKYICHLPGHEAYGMVGTVTIR